ncbi:YhfT family protein [Paenibacillus sp. J5C_2022]|uniref:YhfT family protein n=1 Tax=Paenibacillus sp. J5C2022 TaxID=2977129 RepID=UPI0021CE75DF|nr:YhfT family protein [Paenibacillus sp. J5C2022]MCU6710542.1 YhfT family protein [Paenibacillus sp. J5C2022]
MLPYTWGQMIVVIVMTALTALAARLGKAVFHDGIRPIIPELLEGRMERRELAGISFGLSKGFITSVGIPMAITFQLLNPWLLFLPTDVLGILARRWWMAVLLGAAWGAVALPGLAGMLSLLSAMPVDMMSAMKAFGYPVAGVIALFPLVAILYQFGWRKALGSASFVAAAAVLLARLTDAGLAGMAAASSLLSLAALAIFVAAKQRRLRREAGAASTSVHAELSAAEEEEQQRIHAKALVKSLPLFMAIGACASIACNLGVFAGTDAAMPFLQSAWQGDSEGQAGWLASAAAVDFARLLSFVPMIAATALATGVYGAAGMMLMFPVGYLSPNPVVAGCLGALVIALEVVAVRRMAKAAEVYPVMREAADYIRSAMNATLEIGFLIGGLLAVIKMEGGTPGFGLIAFILLYLANEGMGRPVMRVAIGPVAALLTGLLLNAVSLLPGL